MAGCFGNHPFDRAMEAQLFKHLASEEEFFCDGCQHECDIEDCEIDEDNNSLICPNCGKVHPLDLS